MNKIRQVCIAIFVLNIFAYAMAIIESINPYEYLIFFSAFGIPILLFLVYNEEEGSP